MNLKMISKYSFNQPIDCRHCRLHLGLCVCSLLPHFDVSTKITVLMHRREYFKKTNTGRFLAQIFSDTKILWYGHENRVPFDPAQLFDDSHETCLLFPMPHAVSLSSELMLTKTKPMHLVVCDGNWTQARRMVKTILMQQSFPLVTLPVGSVSAYHLRATKEVNTVCTFEAVARALGVLESPAIQESLEVFFNEFVGRMLKIRGKAFA